MESTKTRFILPLLLLMVTLPVLHAKANGDAQKEGVHFGSIFVKEQPFRLEAAKEQLNQLTDSTQQQKDLENMYPELGKKNERWKKINDRQPASLNNKGEKKEKNKVGVLANAERPKNVVYFLELRPFKENSAKRVYSNPLTLHAPLALLQPGDIVKVTETTTAFLQKQRLDRQSKGLWKKVNGSDQLKDFHLYYDWRNFDTLIPTETPVELSMQIPRGESSVPVFARPGAWTWKDCPLVGSLCVDQLDLNTDVYLFDTKFARLNSMRRRASEYELFYKIGYRTFDKSGRAVSKIGWIPSVYAQRKISQVPKRFLASKTGFSVYETDEERLARLKKYYVFGDNMYSDNQMVSRWMKSRPGENKDVFDRTIQWDGIAGFQQFTLNQSFREETFSQLGVTAGIGVYAPIFIDLEVQGHFILHVPVSHEPADNADFESSMLFRADQWLLYTTPLGIGKLPLKVGFGGYYLSMFTQDANFGFESFIGFQFKAMLENDRYWMDLRFGPVGQDFAVDISNREIGASFGYRLDSERGFKSWTLFGDYGTTSFTDSDTNQTTEFELLQLGLKKSF